ncbi:LamG-like jellyroll fold domain-containing protein, partial [Demequina sp. SO4-13]|uniref:LamG-like jellyroll fold domain-containing protein n=1 Tax=Demequina sp. SO4-13 TaxID=3401027 RepID=UPI003AF50FF3
MDNVSTSFWRRWGTVAASVGLAGSLAVAAVVPAQAAPLAELDADVVLHYGFADAIDDNTIDDLSRNDFHGTVVGTGATVDTTAGVLTLPGGASGSGAGHVSIPADVFEGRDTLTISTWLRNRTASGNYAAMFFGKAASTPLQYWLLNPKNPEGRMKSVITNGNPTSSPWSTEAGVSSTTTATRVQGPVTPANEWMQMTTVITPTTVTGYYNGELVGEVPVTRTISDFGTDLVAYLGRSSYSDPFFNGDFRELTVYETAMTAQQVEDSYWTDDVIDSTLVDDAEAIALDGTSVTNDVTLPLEGDSGSQITWASSDETVISTDGTVTQPSESDVMVTLTATFELRGRTHTADYDITVLSISEAQAVANAAADALTIVEPEDVRGNIHLADESDGVPVTWATSDAAIVAADGVVTRPATDTTVTVTATVTNGEATAQRSFDLTVKAAIELAPLEGYAMSYFTSNSIEGEKIYFAASDGNDVLSWDELNGGDPLFESELSTMGLRDPFIIRSPEGDTFYMIATDLSVGRNGDWDYHQRQGSKYLEVWESHDLVNWSEQRHVKVAPDTAGNAWAPEAYYDDSLGAYVVFWASKLYAEDDPDHTGSTSNVMLYATTRDFVNFSEAQVWQDGGYSRIDSTVLEEDGVYHRFTKIESQPSGGAACMNKDISQDSSTVLTAPLDQWTPVVDCIGDQAGTGNLEGPSIFKSNPGDVNGDYYYLFVDEYGGRGYIPMRSADIADPDWQVAAATDLPASPRHGTVIPVTASELASLRELIEEEETAPPVTTDPDGQVLRYDFEANDGTVLTDVTGNGYDGAIVGGTEVADGALMFDGSDDYVHLPDNIMAGVEDITVEAEVLLDASLSDQHFIYGLGNTDSSGDGNGYLFSEGSPYRTTLSLSNWSGEQNTSQGAPLPRDTWVHLTYTLSGTTATLYLDGVQVGAGTVTVDPADIGNGFTTANYLGRSLYEVDGLFSGGFREFAMYNRALTAQEVADNAGIVDSIESIAVTQLPSKSEYVVGDDLDLDGL